MKQQCLNFAFARLRFNLSAATFVRLSCLHTLWFPHLLADALEGSSRPVAHFSVEWAMGRLRHDPCNPTLTSQFGTWLTSIRCSRLVLILGALECLQVPVQVVITGDTSKSEVPTIAKAVGEPLTPIVWRCIENAARNPARFTADKGPGFLKMVGECVLHVGSTKPCEQCAVIL